MPEPSRPLAEVQQEALEFVRAHASGWVVTINAAGFPVGRTMGVNLNDDGTIDLIQAKNTGRVRHVARNPHLAIAWMNDAYPVPKCVEVRGLGEVFYGDRLVEAYHRRMDVNDRRSGRQNPRRSDEEVRSSLAGIHITPVAWRAEGFGERAEVFRW